MSHCSSNVALAEYLATLKLPRPAIGFAVKAELRMTTDGRGIGVFAAEFLPEGTLVEDEEMADTEFDERGAHAFIEALPNDEERRWWLNHIYCLDNKMKMNFDKLDVSMVNHSDNPTMARRSDGNDYTIRDVHAEEELTEDYRTYDVVPYYEELCKKYGVVSYSDEWNTSPGTESVKLRDEKASSDSCILSKE